MENIYRKNTISTVNKEEGKTAKFSLLLFLPPLSSGGEGSGVRLS